MTNPLFSMGCIALLAEVTALCHRSSFIQSHPQQWWRELRCTRDFCHICKKTHCTCGNEHCQHWLQWSVTTLLNFKISPALSLRAGSLCVLQDVAMSNAHWLREGQERLLDSDWQKCNSELDKKTTGWETMQSCTLLFLFRAFSKTIVFHSALWEKGWSGLEMPQKGDKPRVIAAKLT